MKKLTTFFLILFFISSAFAGDCEPVDLETKESSISSFPRFKVTNLAVTPNSFTLRSATREQSLILKNIISEFDVYKDKSSPLRIEYCSIFLIKGPQAVLKDISTLEERNRDCSARDALVSGRRKNQINGKCELKIRNSWDRGADTWVSTDILERYLISVSIAK